MKLLLTSLLWLVAATACVEASAQGIDKYDTGLPVDISADSLELSKVDNTAIFKGNVIARQGKINMKADRMTVFRSEGKSDDSGPASNISRIEVGGNAFFATPLETAKGDKGVYDVLKKQILLLGNVVLTREKNVLKGDRLEYNLATGKSNLTAGGTAAEQGGPQKGRVRGYFVPEKK